MQAFHAREPFPTHPYLLSRLPTGHCCPDTGRLPDPQRPRQASASGEGEATGERPQTTVSTLLSSFGKTIRMQISWLMDGMDLFWVRFKFRGLTPMLTHSLASYHDSYICMSHMYMSHRLGSHPQARPRPSLPCTHLPHSDQFPFSVVPSSPDAIRLCPSRFSVMSVGHSSMPLLFDT